MKCLLNHHEEVVFGGMVFGKAAQELNSTFWARFKKHHPDHMIFESVQESEWGLCVPIMIHGDKGRTLQKSPIYVLSFELAHGLPPQLLRKCSFDCKRNTRHHSDSTLQWSCAKRASGKRKFAEMDFSGCTMECPAKHLDEASSGNHQRHNNKGHSYLSRFLVSALPSKLYSKNDKALPSLLKETAKELRSLFHEGLKHTKSGSQVKFVFIGAKGDSEWHWEAAAFTRSYHRSGTVRNLMVCPLCDAGAEGVSFTDVSDAPVWLPTVGASDPWDQVPPLNEAPYASRFPASLYKFDPFHVLKFGVFRDAVASTIIRLGHMAYFDYDDSESCGVPERLSRAYALYSMWCLAKGKCQTLKRFSRANFNYGTNSNFPWINAKGSEIVILMMWLEFQLQVFLREPKEPSDSVLLQAMLQMFRGGLSYIGIMHSHGIWLPHGCAKLQLDAGLSFARGYAWLASFFTALRLPGFRLRPKLHYMMHLLMDLKVPVDAGESYALNSALWLCESNEDFIGRISRVSRRVHPKTAAVRTAQRYLVKVRLLLERLHK